MRNAGWDAAEARSGRADALRCRGPGAKINMYGADGDSEAERRPRPSRSVSVNRHSEWVLSFFWIRPLTQAAKETEETS